MLLGQFECDSDAVRVCETKRGPFRSIQGRAYHRCNDFSALILKLSLGFQGVYSSYGYKPPMISDSIIGPLCGRTTQPRTAGGQVGSSRRSPLGRGYNTRRKSNNRVRRHLSLCPATYHAPRYLTCNRQVASQLLPPSLCGAAVSRRTRHSLRAQQPCRYGSKTSRPNNAGRPILRISLAMQANTTASCNTGAMYFLCRCSRSAMRTRSQTSKPRRNG